MMNASREVSGFLDYAAIQSNRVAAGILSPELRDHLAWLGHTYEPDHDYARLNVDIYDCEWRLNAIQANKDRTVTLALSLLTIMEEYTDKSRSPAAFEYANDAIRKLELLLPELEFQKRNIKSQSTVLFNLINQKDSRLNYSVARSSRQIAVTSKRDSSAMKTISILTLVFLPGTFVSAIFSTQIFNFSDPGAGYGRVGKAWWIYMLCCLLLTIVTIGIWAAWTVWRLNKAAEEERKEMGELERDDSEAQRLKNSPLHDLDMVDQGVTASSARGSVDGTRDSQRGSTRRRSHRHSVASISSWSESGRSQRSRATASGRNGSRSSIMAPEVMQNHEKSPDRCSFRGSTASLATNPISASRNSGRGPVDPSPTNTAMGINGFSPLSIEHNAAHALTGSDTCVATATHQGNGGEEAFMQMNESQASHSRDHKAS
ncbi:hypothetical protein H2200_002770 [Cladophialophora chaetospira]|uniref:Uncharacterized protein n=1 Tax=Cladophialophora chaetospira TaxID=386627 RepID=A0AA39CNW4_9EURO|nr:hypothetical protein H2200_002770 [Cladophialophora chaetospira]